jgi:hypothetical protein
MFLNPLVNLIEESKKTWRGEMLYLVEMEVKWGTEVAEDYVLFYGNIKYHEENIKGKDHWQK